MLAIVKTGARNVLAESMPFERWLTLAWTDIRLRYRRTKLGPFWMTLNTAFMILSVGAVWGFIFHMPMREYLPYFAVGMVAWNFISLCIVEGCRVFLDSAHLIKAVPNPPILYVWRSMARQIICLGHNLVFLVVLWVVLMRPLDWGALAAIPGLLLLATTLFGAILVLSILCARYRDIPQFITSVLQVLFLVTPIIWSTGKIGVDQIPGIILHANPLFNLIEVIRAPVLGHPTTSANWLIATFTAGLVLVLGLGLYGRFAKRIPYWI